MITYSYGCPAPSDSKYCFWKVEATRPNSSPNRTDRASSYLKTQCALPSQCTGDDSRITAKVGNGSMRICGCKKSNDEVSHAPGWPSNATVMLPFQIDISIRSQSDLAVPRIYLSLTEPSCLISSDAELLNAFSCWTSNKRIRSCRGTTTDSKRFVGGGYS